MLSDNILTAMAIFSVVTFVGSLIVVPIILARLPVDYFISEERHLVATRSKQPAFFFLNQFVKNFFGGILILAGIAMLILPGQGILTILIGLGITNFPGKYKLERKLVSNQSVFKSLNWMRKRADVEPFLYPLKDK